MISEAVVAHLSADTTVMDFVDGNGYVRIHPLVIPQAIPNTANRVPAIVYSIANVERSVANCGTVGTVATTLNIDTYALTYKQTRDLAKAVRDSLLDYRGLMGGLVEVKTCNLTSEFDTQDIEPGLYRVVQSWIIWHKEN